MSGSQRDEELVVELPMQISERLDDGTRKLENQARGMDRRRHPRLAVGVAAHCQIDGVVSQQAVGDLSVGGLSLRTFTPVRHGSRLRAVLVLPYLGEHRYCSLSGTVVWIGDVDATGTFIGVRFDEDMNAADREILAGFLHLWGSPRAPPGSL